MRHSRIAIQSFLFGAPPRRFNLLAEAWRARGPADERRERRERRGRQEDERMSGRADGGVAGARTSG
ncbi:hypothetical protein OC842_007974 [Tilletia horrida]|uniref:Uncharacterized protein n=1 Tax=Tilletia horrida TaxID=155126 RepID=A0AAN6JGD2_9BASI|nr:hypothetical protein OC842_007974 [Tilletia horrida]